MKTIKCDVCGKSGNMVSTKDVAGWYLAHSDSESDLCPPCYEDLYNFLTKVRENYIRVKIRKNKTANKPAVSLVVH